MSEQHDLINGVEEIKGVEPGNPKEAAYDEHIWPLVTNIRELCREHGIQFVVGFDITDPARRDEPPLLCTTSVIDTEKYGPVSKRVAYALDILLGDRPMVPTLAEFFGAPEPQPTQPQKEGTEG